MQVHPKKMLNQDNVQLHFLSLTSLILFLFLLYKLRVHRLLTLSLKYIYSRFYTVLTLNDLPCSCLGSDSHWIPLVLSSSLPCTGVCKRDVMEKKKKQKKKKQTNLSVFNQCNANWGGFEMITRFLRYPRGFYPYHILP